MIYISFLICTWEIERHLVCVLPINRVPTKLEKQNSMTDLLLSMTPILTWFQIWLWLSHNMHDNHKLESCHSHENKQFHDFSMTSSYFPWLFGKFSHSKTFPWRQFFPGFSMTAETLNKLYFIIYCKWLKKKTKKVSRENIATAHHHAEEKLGSVNII